MSDQAVHTTQAAPASERSKGFLLFSIIWFGDFISTIGSGLTAFALGVYAFRVTGQAAASAMVVLCNFLPAFLLRPIGGVLADRMNRLLLLLVGNFGSAAGILLVLVLVTLYPHQLWIVYPGLIISSVFFGLQNPAYKASVSDFIPAKLYAKASGLVQLSSASQFLISPILGGILMSLFNIHYVLTIDIMTFVFSAIIVLVVKLSAKMIKAELNKAPSHFLKDMVEGMKPITQSRGISVLVILLALLLFCIGLIEALSIPLVLSFTSARSLGIAQSVSAIGMILSSILVSMFERKRKNVHVLGVSLLAMGICFSFIGIFPSIWAIIVPSFLFFCVVPFANSSIDVLLRTNISNELQGRAWAMISVCTTAGAILAYSTSGYLADKIFNPLFLSHGFFAHSLGRVFGVGPGRGIAFMFFIAGVSVAMLSFAVLRSKAISRLENQNVSV